MFTDYFKKKGMKDWDDDLAAQILYDKNYDELDEDERGELAYEYWDFIGYLSN